MDSETATRRRVLETLGAAGVVGLAGCSGGGDGTDTETQGDGDGGGDGNGGGDGGGDGNGGGDGGGDGDGGSTPQSVSGTVTVGMLQPTTGSLQPYGNQALAGFYSALGYKGDPANIPGTEGLADDPTIEVGDVTYDFLVRDSKNDPGEAQSLAGDLVRNEGVDMLAGVTNSAGAQTVAGDIAGPSQTPYMAGPAAAVNLTADSQFCNDQTFRASENVAMDAFSGGQYIANETDISSVYIYYANYSFGESVNQYYTSVLENNGVSVAGRTALPPGYAEDWPGQFQKAVDADVDAIIGGFTVSTLPDMVGTFVQNNDQYDFAFAGGYTTRVGAFLVGSTIVQTLDGDLTQEALDGLNFGPFTTRYHWNQYDNPVNDGLVDIHTDKYGYYPDLFTSGMFTGASAIHEAAQAAGSTNPQDIRDELSGLTVTDTPKGEGAYTFQGYNNQARSPMTVSDPMPTTEEAGQFWQFQGNPVPFMPSEPTQTFAKDQTTLKSDAETMNCSL